jgi:double-stranded uracil-DNA glycosylase
VAHPGRLVQRRVGVGAAHPRPALTPTRAELLTYEGRTLPDVIAPGLTVLFVGINPGLYTAWAGHHFARKGNRFWPALYAGGFTPRILDPSEEHDLIALGYGITNVVQRATATAAELKRAEYVAGGKRLKSIVARYTPKWIAVLGVGAYRVAFDAPSADVGEQDEMIGSTKVWLLPSPSGLNAHYQPRDLAKLFRKFREAVG